MRQLTFIEPGRFELWDVPRPVLASDTDAIVRPLAVARCDLDLYIADGTFPYRGPFAFGHEAIAEVVEAGSKAGVVPGQRVAVPFQLSCGRCPACRRGFTNSCAEFPFRAAFGLKPASGVEFGGALSDLMRVPFADHALVPVPGHLDPTVLASAPDNMADGWRAVAGPLGERPGATVLVVGGRAQSVALYAAGWAVTLGAGHTLYLDDDPGRRALAERLGAAAAPLAELLAAPAGKAPQFEITVDGSGDPAALAFAIAATAPNGICTSVAIYNEPTTPLPLLRMYGKGITFHTGRVQARAVLPAVLAHCAHGHFHPEHVTSRIVRFSDAAEAMTDPGPKLVFVNDWDG
jgi:threonine dehydrogenase-like Zn-dependent dehydrogenase